MKVIFIIVQSFKKKTYTSSPTRLQEMQDLESALKQDPQSCEARYRNLHRYELVDFNPYLRQNLTWLYVIHSATTASQAESSELRMRLMELNKYLHTHSFLLSQYGGDVFGCHNKHHMIVKTSGRNKW